MSDRLERALRQLPEGGGPPATWQDQVRRRIESAPAAPSARRWLVPALAGAGLVAAAAAVTLVWVLRRPEPSAPPGPRVERAAVAPTRSPRAGEEHLLAQAVQRLTQELDQVSQSFQAAESAADRARLRRELRQKLALLRKKRAALARLHDKANLRHRAAGAGRDAGTAPEQVCDSSDPLCGLK